MMQDEDESEKVQNFLEHFCEMNALDINDIPEANGALKQSEWNDS